MEIDFARDARYHNNDHPQWGTRVTDVGQFRRYNMANRLLERFGEKPLYTQSKGGGGEGEGRFGPTCRDHRASSALPRPPPPLVSGNEKSVLLKKSTDLFIETASGFYYTCTEVYYYIVYDIPIAVRPNR